MPKTLYRREKAVLGYIQKYLSRHDHAPTLQEIADHLGLKALSTVHAHLARLERKGFISRKDVSRELTLQSGISSRVKEIISTLSIPLVGTVTAGNPIEAIEETDEYINIPADMLGRTDNVFALRVRGDSMIDCHICDGDTVILNKQSTAQNGEMVVALLEDNTATLKQFYREANRIRLQPANRNYAPIYAQSVSIQGVVKAVLRTML